MENLRVVTLNLWGDRGRSARRLEVVAEGLRALEPDLVGLQEVREGPLTAQATTLSRLLGLYPAFGAVDASAGGDPLGNAVLSRFPIVHSSNLELPGRESDPRGALQVEVETPSGTVRLTSCHLSWEPDAAPVREAQVLALDELTRAPSSVHAFLVGDLNAGPRSRAVRFLCGLDSLEGRGTFFRDAWARRHPSEEGFTWSAANPNTVRWIEQNRRIRLRPRPRRSHAPRRADDRGGARRLRPARRGRHLAFGPLRGPGGGAHRAPGLKGRMGSRCRFSVFEAFLEIL